jgi:signal peptidase I
MSLRLVRRVVATALTVAAVAALWWFLAPPQVGGRTAWAVVEGTSMEPELSAGDLVIVRARSSYDVDDVVLFESETLGGAHVLHRIVGVESGRFVSRGDNRTHDDPDRLAEDDVIGGLWITIPAVGSALAWLGQPLPLAIVLFVLVFAALAGGRELSRARAGAAGPPVRAERPAASPGAVRLGSVSRSLLAAGLAAAILFGALALVSWSHPTTRRVTVDDAYAHAGRFSYDAAVKPSAVYPAGRVETGQAVFRELVERVPVAFSYRFSAAERASLRGSIGLEAVVSDGEGWSRSIPLAAPKPFTGLQGRTTGVLELRRLDAATTRMRSLTGTGPATFEVTLTPLVQVSGYVGSTVIDTSFEPTLQFSYDGLALRPLQPEGERSALSPSVSGATTRTADAPVGLGALSIPIADARAFASVGLVVSLLLVGGCVLVLWRAPAAGPAAVLHARYATRLVPAVIEVPDGRWVTDVRDAESLGMLAEHYDRVILHAVEPGADVYLVDDGVTVYRFRACPAPLPSTVVSPVAGT